MQEGCRCAQLALFFFLLLLEGAELHEGYFDEKPLVLRRFVVDVGFGEHLQASEKSLCFDFCCLLNKALFDGVWGF